MPPTATSAAAAVDDPPAPRGSVVTAQRRLLAAGAVALVVGREVGRTWLLAVGGSTVIAAMAVLAVLDVGVRGVVLGTGRGGDAA